MAAGDPHEPIVEVRCNSEPIAAAGQRRQRGRHIVIQPPVLRLSKVLPELVKEGAGRMWDIVDHAADEAPPALALVRFACRQTGVLLCGKGKTKPLANFSSAEP